MEKIISLAFSLMIVATVGNAQPSKQSLTKKNLAADNIFLKALRTGDISVLDDIIAVDFLNHTGEHRGLDSLKSSVSQFHLRMKPASMDLVRQMADEDYVADWVRYNFADTNFKIEGIEMTRYREGKAVEHWFFSYNQPRKR